MMEAKATWAGPYQSSNQFVGTGSSGHALILDAGDGDNKSATSPLEVVLVGLCACTGSDVVSILRKKRESFTTVEVRAQAERSETFPKVFTHIQLTYRIGGNVNRKAVEDAVNLSKEKYCTVSAMLGKSAKIEFTIELDANRAVAV